MNELERRLRRDAERIEADVPPEVTARIRAAVKSDAQASRRSAFDERSDGDRRIAGGADFDRSGQRRAGPPLRLWAAASLSGIAAVLLVVLLLPRLGPDDAARVPPVAAPVVMVPPDIAREFPLVVKTADLTAPLEKELDDLKSDMEKARERVERDLDF